MDVSIIRITRDYKEPQRGVLVVDGEPLILTLELPWKDNQLSVSCIPEGVFECKKTYGRTIHSGAVIPETFEVFVPGRGGILFHTGNTASNSKGCIITGSYFGDLNGEKAVLNSRKAFQVFLDRFLNKDRFHLTVRRSFYW